MLGMKQSLYQEKIDNSTLSLDQVKWLWLWAGDELKAVSGRHVL